MKSRFENKVVFITGASSGIGAALARELAQLGAKLVLTARRMDRLENLKKELATLGAEALTLGCDVTVDGDVEKAMAEAIAHFGRIDFVIANAGFGVVGRFENLALEDYKRQFETNVFGVIRTAHAAFPELKRTQGSLTLLGSVASYISLPNSSAYAMSKFSVRALANSLYGEWRPQGVQVTLLTPGFIQSEIRQVDNKGQLHKSSSEPLASWMLVPADKAAKAMLRAIGRRKREQVITAHGKLFVFMAHCCPWVFRWLARLGTEGRGEPGK